MEAIEVVGIVVAVVGGLVALVFALGWIIPLIIGRAWRLRNRPGARGWTIFGCVWGGVAVAWIVAIGGVAFLASRVSRDYAGFDSKASDFDMASYKGDTATLRFAYPGEACLVVSDEERGSMKFAVTNGVLTVPAGRLRIRSYEATALDDKGRKWTARAIIRGESAITAESGKVQDVKLGPPFKAAVEITYSAVSDRVSLSPAYADGGGNEFSISSDKRTGKLPEFQFLDKDGSVVWSGKFEYG